MSGILIRESSSEKGSDAEKIGSNARFEIEKLLEGKVNLRLWVKVRKGWRDSDIQMKKFWI